MTIAVVKEPLNAEIQAEAPEEADLFRYTTGPRTAEVLLVGEAWGASEEAAQKPFVGASGKELDRILSEAGLSRERILCCNLVNKRPPGNDFSHYLYPEAEKKVAPHVLKGIRPRKELLSGLEALYKLVNHVKPKLIITCGNWPLWALTSLTIPEKSTGGYRLPSGAVKWRGSQLYSDPIQGKSYPLLPLIHPAAILREAGWRQITVHDLRSRAKRYLEGKLSWDPPGKTFMIHRPTWAQIEQRLSRILTNLEEKETWLAVDLETWRRKWITVVGLADEQVELCIPLIYGGKSPGEVINYLTLDQEFLLWKMLKKILEHPNVRIIGQNFIYDTEWFYRYYNINAKVTFDPMVAHHLLFPGTPKRLDYLASLYNDYYSYWKDESGDWDTLPNNPDRYWTYNCKDTRATYNSGFTLKALVTQAGFDHLYAEKMEQWELSREMMLRGTLANAGLQSELRLELLQESMEISEWLLGAVPETWRYTSTGKPWFQSPKGTADLFYKCLGLTPILHKKTKQPTTDDAALAELSERTSTTWLSPLLERLRHLRSLGVFVSHFLDAKLSPDGRMRCSFNISHPETHRWSSNSNGFGEGTNLQNIPRGD